MSKTDFTDEGQGSRRMTASPDFTISDVLAWARTKPADEEYDYYNRSHCAVAQFGRATGRDHLVGLFSEGLDAVSRDISDAVVDRHYGGWTFGALVTRLEALCPDQVIPPSEWTRLDAYMVDELVGREA